MTDKDDTNATKAKFNMYLLQEMSQTRRKPSSIRTCCRRCLRPGLLGMAAAALIMRCCCGAIPWGCMGWGWAWGAIWRCCCCCCNCWSWARNCCFCCSSCAHKLSQTANNKGVLNVDEKLWKLQKFGDTIINFYYILWFPPVFLTAVTNLLTQKYATYSITIEDLKFCI